MWSQVRLLPYSLLYLLLSSAGITVNVEPRSLSELTDEELTSLASTPPAAKHLDPYDPNSHLFKILIPRAPTTENNTLVRTHIVNTLKQLNWHIEEDEFEGDTPYGKKTFTNVIATKDPDAPHRLIMSAHFDSKFFPSAPMNQFLGATDSAAPCAMLLDLAEALNPLLEARQKRIENETADSKEEDAANTTLQLVFFDGEEAFKDWTATDSIYGSRHLAEKWSTEYSPLIEGRRLGRSASKLSTIEHLVLLDLLGATKPLVQSWFLSTAWLFDGLVAAERRMGALGMFNEEKSSNAEGGEWHTWDSFFVPRTNFETHFGRIGDDHVPFLERGVNVLHVIASPFPRVWHSLKDDATALDIPTMKRWNLIFRIFVAEYMRLKPSSSKSKLERTNDELV